MEILNHFIIDDEIIGVSAMMTKFDANAIYWRCGFVIYTKQNKIEIWSDRTMDDDEKKKDYSVFYNARLKVIEFLTGKVPSIYDVENHDPEKV